MLGIEKIKCDCGNEVITAYLKIWSGEKMYEKAICRVCVKKMLSHPMAAMLILKLPKELQDVLAI